MTAALALFAGLALVLLAYSFAYWLVRYAYRAPFLNKRDDMSGDLSDTYPSSIINKGE